MKPAAVDRALRAALVALHAVGPLRHLASDAWDYDEGPNLQAAVWWLRGAALYRDVPLNKPPVVVLLTTVATHLGGPSVATARAAFLAVSLAGLWCFASLASSWWGAGAGVASLALLALVPELGPRLSAVMADLPALSLALAALSLANRAGDVIGEAGYRRRCALAGCVFGLALTTHPLVLGWALPVAWAATRGHRVALRRAWLPLAVACAATSLAALAPFDVEGVLRWVLRYNRAPLHATLTPPNATVMLGFARERAPWLLAAVPSLALTLRGEGRRGAVVAAMAFAAMVATFARWAPLWENYALWMHLPLLLLCAGGAAIALRSRLSFASAALAAALAMAMVDRAHAPTPWPAWTPSRLALRAAIARETRPWERVVSDDPFVVYAAGRAVPAGLVDTSMKRIVTGWLDADAVMIEASRGAMVVSATGRFARVPGLEERLRARYGAPRAVGDAWVYAR